MRTTSGSGESKYLLGWGSLVGVLAALVGILLYLLVSSIAGDDPPINQAAVPGLSPAPEDPAPIPAVTRTPPTPRPTPTPAKRPAVQPKPERPAPPPARNHGVKITYPVERQGVGGRQGVLITGTAGDLGGRALRVFDLADNGLYYLVDGGPPAIRDGQWSVRYRNIGEGMYDIGNVFTMTAVAADAPCQRVLESARPNHEGDRPFRRLPEGCRIVDQVRIIKIAP